MSLPQAKSRIPTSIGDLKIILYDYIESEENPAHKEAIHEIDVLNGENEVMKTVYGDLIPHLDETSPIQKEDLIAWANWLRQKAEDEILP